MCVIVSFLFKSSSSISFENKCLYFILYNKASYKLLYFNSIPVISLLSEYNFNCVNSLSLW